jgi:hypothetical protein
MMFWLVNFWMVAFVSRFLGPPTFLHLPRSESDRRGKTLSSSCCLSFSVQHRSAFPLEAKNLSVSEVIRNTQAVRDCGHPISRPNQTLAFSISSTPRSLDCQFVIQPSITFQCRFLFLRRLRISRRNQTLAFSISSTPRSLDCQISCLEPFLLRSWRFKILRRFFKRQLHLIFHFQRRETAMHVFFA